jgi:acetyl esterase
MAAGLDVLRDQSRALVERLRVAEVRHSHVEIPGVTHGFLVYANALPEAVDAIDTAGRFALLNA